MDAFEQLVSEILWMSGFWVRTSVKVELTKEEKRLIGRYSAPRWELDIVGDFENAMQKISLKASELQQAFDVFRARQVDGEDGSEPTESKQKLRNRLRALDDELNHYLAGEFGVVPTKKQNSQWLKSHQPFHWFVEFYGIMSAGGFDVIIGNPPYVEFSRSNVGYEVNGLATAECDNLWAFALERSCGLLNEQGRMSLITPLSLVSTARFAPVYRMLASTARYATFLTLSGDAHPSVLFAGVKMSFTIFTYAKTDQPGGKQFLHTSKLYRWLANERENLFSLIQYQTALPLSNVGIPFKLGSELAANVVKRINAQQVSVGHLHRRDGVALLYHRIVRHFVKVLFTAPFFRNERDGEKRSEDYKILLFEDDATAKLVRSFLVSSCYYTYFVALSDAYHCGRDLVLAFPVGLNGLPAEDKDKLIAAGIAYERDLFKHAVRRRIRYRTTGWIEYDEFYPRESKPIADEIDHVLARHYGLTEDELDFIINYDIKYRMGADSEDEEQE